MLGVSVFGREHEWFVVPSATAHLVRNQDGTLPDVKEFS